MCSNDRENDAHQVDDQGLPIVSQPPGKTFAERLQKVIIMYVLVPVLAPCIIVVKTLRDEGFRKDFWGIYTIVNASPRIQEQSYYQDSKLMSLLWKQPSAKQYILNGALEFQNSEGYCGRATLRCILQSFGDMVVPRSLIPPVKRGETKPEKWCADIQQLVTDSEDKVQLKTEIVSGDVPYEKFLQTLERMESSPESSRVAINYLRPALFGFKWPKFLPSNFVFGMFGGHFSPVVGIVRENRPPNDPLVGVFDVNHTYNGAYLVPATVLHASVKAKDVGSSKSRAVIVVSTE